MAAMSGVEPPQPVEVDRTEPDATSLEDVGDLLEYRGLPGAVDAREHDRFGVGSTSHASA
jgi:hypothetical protein